MKHATPADPGYVQRVHDSYARQAVMRTLGATLDGVEPGRAHHQRGRGQGLAT